MHYERKIKYFYYRKDGECLQGAGFVKMELRDGICNLQMQISRLPMQEALTRQVYLVTNEQEKFLDNINLQEGKGTLQARFEMGTKLLGIRIPIAHGRELYCGISEETSIREDAEFEESAQIREDAETEESAQIREDAEVEESAQICAAAEVEEKNGLPEDIPASMLFGKWEQLSAIYPHIQPFRDSRDYLRVGPEDFVVLSGKSYSLVHNSFLLHGYYNYKHLILARQEWRNEAQYYIGVPGNFYEREKQVALMFGFESFECEEEPAQTGVFGYYMIRVDL